MKNFIAAYLRFALPHPAMRKYIGTSIASQNTKNAIRSRERKIPMIAPSSSRNQNVYALTRCSMLRATASRPIGNSTAVIDDHEDAEAVDADDVADAERVEPTVLLDELEAADAGLELPEQQEREAQRRDRRDDSRPRARVSGRRAGVQQHAGARR